MEAVTVRRETRELDVLSLITGPKVQHTGGGIPKIRHRTIRLTKCLQPKPWEEKFNGLWCNEAEY